ncbi:MAG: hypothetical protein FWC71_12080 [Defluviitaleaceae bacterium]|nr:hypothetical protein [Defluviitaleaceae bacterium]
MGRRGGGMRSGGGMRGGGGGRLGGGLGGRSTGGGSLGGFGGGARRTGQGLGSAGRAPRPMAPRAAAPRPRVAPRGGSFGMGMATGMMMGRRRSMWGWGGGWGWGRRRRMMMGGPMMHGGGGGGCGCFTMILGVLLLVIVVGVIGQFANLGMPGGGGGFMQVDVPRSTVNRDALPRGAANTPSPRYVDHLGWINVQSPIINGMTRFHNETGVMPFVYITDTLSGNRNPNAAQITQYAENLFTRGVNEWNLNEANVLIFVIDNENGYDFRIVAGHQASAVLDAEAIDILSASINFYWYSDMSGSEMFNRAFIRAGDRMMSVTRSPWFNVLIVAGVALILFLLFTWWKAKRDQKNLEAEQTEAILNADLTEFGNTTHDEASRLAQQYQNQDDDQNPYR